MRPVQMVGGFLHSLNRVGNRSTIITSPLPLPAWHECFAATLRKHRLEQALALLKRPNLAQLSVADIGAGCGFPDPSHFSREFHRTCGALPAKWRLLQNDQS